VPALAVVEREAARRFAGLGLLDDATLAATTPAATLHDAAAAGRLLVATVDAAPVGFALVGRVDDGAHLHELDVLPAHGRRGIGAALLDAVVGWAVGHGLPHVTLITFRDVPWNGPFYARHGFRPLDDADCGPGLRALRAAETAAGLPVAARGAMRRPLDVASADPLP
jgi:GNAT superfamily N-acetyltransferase